MLHAFDPSQNGLEVMTYVPAELYQNGSGTEGLHYLSDSAYTHKYYIDANLTTSDIFANLSNGAFGSASWATILTGSYGAGGKGVFALDITNPTFANNVAGATNTILWEFTDTNSPYMGYSFSEPRIAQLNNGEWAVLFGNGYNSSNGKAALMILYIDQGVDGTWSTGDFKIIDTNSGSVSNKNGLGQISALDLDGDFIIDRVYGGDIQGNLWAFDLLDSNATNWGVAYTGNKALFQSQPGQAITVKSATTRTTTNTDANRPNVLVIFGTGQFLTDADPTNTNQQSLYGVWGCRCK